jgi:tight adherence protein B
MLPTWAIFLTMLVLVFGVVMRVTAPTPKENIIARRLRDILKSPSIVARIPGKPTEVLLGADHDNSGRVRLFFQKTKTVRHLQRFIFQSHVRTSLKVVLGVTTALSVAVYLAVWHLTVSIFISLTLAFIAGSLPFAYLSYRRKKWLVQFNATLPECIDTFSRSLRAGHSIVAGLDIVAQQAPEPANAEFAEVFKKQKYGLPLREALLQMIERVPSMDLKIMITAILVQKETGGNLPNVLDRLVAVIRDRLRIQRDIRVHTAQGRLTGWILGILPPFLMLAINLISPNYSSSFLHDPAGRRMLYISVALLFTGVFVIRRIVNGIEV